MPAFVKSVLRFILYGFAMKRFVLVCAAVCCMSFFGSVAVSGFRVSDTEISLLTADPGEDLYSVFGHSAIRVKNIEADVDVVFNYGLFDFNQPNFYLNFARGRMNYRLGTESYEHFVVSYARENRNIREQVFDLDSTRKEFVIRFLENNNRPENCYYLYHFFLDNCATRIRDLMLKTCDGSVLPAERETPTYRELIYRHTRSHPWGRFGIDIALGLPTDQKTDMYAQMFLPEYLFDGFAQTVCNGRPIVKQTNDIFRSDESAIQPPGFITPMVVCCLILVLSIIFCFAKKGVRIFDFTLFFTVGLVGMVVFLLWFFTDHTNTHNNLNIIWALPTHLVMAFFLLSKKRGRFVRTYFSATAVIAVLLLAGWVFLPQKLNVALVPLVLGLALRAFRIGRIG